MRQAWEDGVLSERYHRVCDPSPVVPHPGGSHMSHWSVVPELEAANHDAFLPQTPTSIFLPHSASPVNSFVQVTLYRKGQFDYTQWPVHVIPTAGGLRVSDQPELNGQQGDSGDKGTFQETLVNPGLKKRWKKTTDLTELSSDLHTYVMTHAWHTGAHMQPLPHTVTATQQ